ncbi:MAG: peptide ABC transporter substrate-binding protein [Chlamydiota bacterium]
MPHNLGFNYHKRAKQKALMIIFFSAFLLISCSGKEENDREKRNVLRIGIDSSIRSLDPQVGIDCPATHAIRMIFECLLRRGADGTAIVPGVAERYTLSEDRCIYTFYLRSSYWSNGDPVTAHDFEWAWKRALSPGSAQLGSFIFDVIKNAAAYRKGNAAPGQVGVRAVDDRILVVHLERPTPYFPALVCSTMYAPLHSCYRTSKKVISNGPFTVKKWKQGQLFVVERNPTYWDADSVILDEICLQVIPDPVAQFYLYEQGELDYIGEPFSPLAIDVVKKSRFESAIARSPSTTVSWIFINTESFPLTHPKLRRALALALDRKILTQHLLELGEVPTQRVLTIPGVSNARFTRCSESQAQARRYFSAALAELSLNREALPPIRLSHRSAPWATRLMQAVQQQWQDILGLRVELESADWATHFSKVAQSNYQLAEMRWVFWFDDPIHLLGSFGDKELAINVTRWDNREYRENLIAADWAQDQVERNQWLLKAEAKLLDQMPVIPLYFAQLSYLKQSHVAGVTLSRCSEIDFKTAYLTHAP